MEQLFLSFFSVKKKQFLPSLRFDLPHVVKQRDQGFPNVMVNKPSSSKPGSQLVKSGQRKNRQTKSLLQEELRMEADYRKPWTTSRFPKANGTDFEASLLDVEGEAAFHFLSEGQTLSPSLPSTLLSAASGSRTFLFSISLPQRDSSISPSLPLRPPTGCCLAADQPTSSRRPATNRPLTGQHPSNVDGRPGPHSSSALSAVTAGAQGRRDEFPRHSNYAISHSASHSATQPVHRHSWSTGWGWAANVCMMPYITSSLVFSDTSANSRWVFFPFFLKVLL